MRFERHQDARPRQAVEGVPHHVALAGGDVELEVELERHGHDRLPILGLVPLRMKSERDVDARHDLGTDRMVVLAVEGEHRARRQLHADVIGKDGGVLAQLVRDVERVGPPERRLLIVGTCLPVAARHGHDRVVNDEDVERGASGPLLVSRFFLALRVEPYLLDLDRLDIAILGQPGWHGVERAKPVGGHRLDLLRGRGHDEIRRADRPSRRIRIVARRRHVARISARGAGVHPCRDRRNLGVVQGRIVLELLDADVLLDEPRRHLVLRRARLDAPRPRAHLLVCRQRHGAHAALAVTVLARSLENGRDVLRERHRPLSRRVRDRPGAWHHDHQRHEHQQPEQTCAFQRTIRWTCHCRISTKSVLQQLHTTRSGARQSSTSSAAARGPRPAGPGCGGSRGYAGCRDCPRDTRTRTTDPPSSRSESPRSMGGSRCSDHRP